MIPAAVLVRLATLGLSAEHAEAVSSMLSDVEAATKAEAGGAIEARRAMDRERKQRQREKERAVHVTSRDVTGQDVTSADAPPSPSLPPQTPQTHPHPPVGSLRAHEGVDLQAEFDREFWPRYPHKVGKPDAQRKFVAARKSVLLADLMAGLDRYIASKPEDRPWCNPATWLHQQRWADEPAPAPTGLRVIAGQGPAPPAKMKSVGHRLADRLREIAEGPEPSRDPDEWRTIDAHAHHR